MKISVRWKLRLAWSVLAFFPSLSAWASTEGSDVEVALVIEPDRIVVPDTEGVLHVTAINHGSVSVTPWMVLAIQSGGGYFLNIVPDADTAPCTFAAFVADGLPGNPSYGGLMLWPGLLPAGDSVTCRLKFRVGPEALGAVQLYASAYPGIDDEYDPDQLNNVIRTRIIVRPVGAGPEPVPVPAVVPLWDEKTALFLILVVMIAGALRYVRR